MTGSALNIAKTGVRRLRVMAGPGTGKTFALQKRVARLLEQGQDPTRIMAVTFTRNAAASLKEDLADYSISSDGSVHAGTLHSYCFELLTKKDVFAYLNRIPRTITTFSTSGSLQFEGSSLINDLIAETPKFGGKRECTKHVLAFEADWARLQSEQPGWPTNSMDKLFEERLLNWLRFHKAMLVGELVPVALDYLRANPASDARTTFDHVIVDEYQDLNRAEQQIIDLLACENSLMIVGDKDQSIYSFRHAHPDGIVDFHERHPATHDETLAECRRCPTRVVAVADHLIGQNYPPNTPPRLQPKSDNEQGEIHIVQWTSRSTEAKEIAGYIDHLINNRNYQPSEILVIAPRKLLGYEMLNIIRRKDIPIHSFYHEEALEKKSAQRAFALLTLLSDSEDRVALRWWLGHDTALGRSTSYQKLRKYCEESGRSPKDVLEAISSGDLSLPGISPLLAPFKELSGHLARLSELDLPELIDDLLPIDDADCHALREMAECALADSKNFDQLFSCIRSNFTNPEVPAGGYVRIMSPQKAKGLTSKVVIVTGCVEELIPFVDNSWSEQKCRDQIREQRRLFYVAITRCIDILVLSSFGVIESGYARRMGTTLKNYGKFQKRTITSRFINELGHTAPLPVDGLKWRKSGYSATMVG